MYKMMFSLQNNNNGALSGDKAMPQKDLTSDNDTTFEINRKSYLKTVLKAVPAQISPEKKWMPSRRDASDVARRRRVVAVGKGSINSSPSTLSFTTYTDINTTNDALRRVRAGGSVAPAKKNAQLINPIVPSYAPAVPTTSIIPIKYPTMYH
jgi:hypothetical protein